MRDMAVLSADLNQWDDKELVERAVLRGAADDRPFSVLFNRHKELVWRVCYRFTENATDAEDLLQEVFIKAHRGLPSFQSRSTFRTWIYRIAVNTCRNELRSRGRRPQLVDMHIDDLELLDPETSANEPFISQFESISLALLALQEQEREILIMREIEGLPYDEIAMLLGVKLSAAKMRTQRARIALTREMIRQQYEDRNE